MTCFSSGHCTPYPNTQSYFDFDISNTIDLKPETYRNTTIRSITSYSTIPTNVTMFATNSHGGDEEAPQQALSYNWSNDSRESFHCPGNSANGNSSESPTSTAATFGDASTVRDLDDDASADGMQGIERQTSFTLTEPHGEEVELNVNHPAPGSPLPEEPLFCRVLVEKPSSINDGASNHGSKMKIKIPKRRTSFLLTETDGSEVELDVSNPPPSATLGEAPHVHYRDADSLSSSSSVDIFMDALKQVDADRRRNEPAAQHFDVESSYDDNVFVYTPENQKVDCTNIEQGNELPTSQPLTDDHIMTSNEAATILAASDAAEQGNSKTMPSAKSVSKGWYRPRVFNVMGSAARGATNIFRDTAAAGGKAHHIDEEIAHLAPLLGKLGIKNVGPTVPGAWVD